MKKQHVLWLFVSLFLLAVPAAQTFASDDEVEITLLEVSGFLPGNDPLGNPIDLSDVTISSVTISDASTGYVWLTPNAGPCEEISISSLPRGRYIISVVANGDTYSRMFLKR